MGGVVEYRDACVCSFVCALVCALVCLSVICLGHNTSDLRQICDDEATRCYFNVRSKADIHVSQLNLPHGTDN